MFLNFFSSSSFVLSFFSFLSSFFIFFFFFFLFYLSFLFFFLLLLFLFSLFSFFFVSLCFAKRHRRYLLLPVCLPEQHGPFKIGSPLKGNFVLLEKQVICFKSRCQIKGRQNVNDNNFSSESVPTFLNK